MRWKLAALVGLSLPSPGSANDWEKFYHSLGRGYDVTPATSDPEVLMSSGDADRDIDEMWRKGYGAIGYTSFSTSNNNTSDGVRLAKKLKASYVILSAKLTSSNTVSMPLTLPNTTTSHTTGNASVSGSSGYATGTYSGTTTTYGNQTTYIPITISRFDKGAIYFSPIIKSGSGIYARELTPEEMVLYDTRRALVVRSVRDGSPAYNSDIFPGDVILQVNGAPADFDNWHRALIDDKPLKVHFVRNNQQRDLEMSIPPEWRPKK